MPENRQPVLEVSSQIRLAGLRGMHRVPDLNRLAYRPAQQRTVIVPEAHYRLWDALLTESPSAPQLQGRLDAGTLDGL